ncbi:helix-turn-helix domain-containing protein [Luteimonas sp. FCS-9]|uniref:helix-turn-helix domain-containing protein n=1 Tax=Luteimonas sp. FCS-9 TaxID=1547516 RepID=UPI00063E806C|nr:helix-turn-helix domain-containing protein [Luteimonas sp. FCS-9]KLJ02096.1 hypothetical protein WQ56_04520 [Luteimonas sp. FCS-9]
MSSSHQAMPETTSGVGERLRVAREQAGLGVADVASRLRMRVRVVEALEAEDWGRLGAQVFVRGQLRSYLRLLGLPDALADSVPEATEVRPPELTPRTFTPPMQRLLDKAMGRAVYVVITALIVVPVWVATRQHVDGASEITASLGVAGDEDAPAQPAGPRPVTASLGALPKRPAVVAPPAEAAPREQAGRLTLRFNGPSWVEVVGHDGQRIESAEIPGGEQREFATADVRRVVLGNAGAVEVLRDGVVQDLSEFRRSNVARFEVSSERGFAPAAE